MTGTHHETVQDVLDGVGAEVGAAESHGMLCGMLSGPRDADRARWIAEVLADTEPKGEAARACLETLSLMYDETTAAFAEENFEFAPLLPDEEADLVSRTRAMGEWCRGFLFGVGYTQPGADSALPAEVREALSDLAEIARVASRPDEEEDDEEAYTEVLEYVRVAVLLCREHLAGIPRASGDAS